MGSIEARNLVRKFGGFTAVADLSFEVARGDVLGFLGPNGAGKSTTMKMLTGFLRPTAGRVRIAGVDMADTPRAGQTAIGYLPEGAPAWGDMTPRRFLDFIARIRGLDKPATRAATARAVEVTELAAVLDRPIDTLSKGYRRRVGLAQAILHDPDVLIMDEPTDGLDPNQKFHIRRAIAEMAADKAIIISTHILEEVDAVCTRALIIDHGRLVASGTPTELAARSRYHGAVTLSVVSAEAEKVAAGLRAHIANVAVEARPRGDETTFFVLPETPTPDLIEKIGALAQRENWPLRGLALEAGRLDDVFRRLTRTDTDEAA